MAIERRAVKKRILKSGKDRTDTAVYVLLKYGVTDDADVAEKLVRSKDEVLFPSDLSYYNDQVDQDLGMGKSSPEVVKIRTALAEFYGLYEPEQETEEEEVAPDGLDDLLGSIREEDLEEPSAPPLSALAIYEGVREDDIVEEDIDERILKLLKLDGVHDIDYATYMTLLKERMAAARMPNSSIATEEDELIRDEFKRVKGKVGRFKLKKKRITAEDLGESGPVKVSSDQFFLTSSAIIPTKVDDEEKSDDEVLKKLDDILKSIRMENDAEKKKTTKDKKDKEAEDRRNREKKLESKKRKEFASLIKNVVAPVTSFLEKIINWIKYTFIGFIFNQALAWFRDPANQNKVKAIGKFLETFFPAILAAAVLFLTPFGGFIRTTLKLFRWAIPKLLGIIKRHPKLAAAAALLGAGAIIPQLFPGTVNEQERKTANAPGSNAEKIEALKKQKENLNPLQILQGVGSEIDEQIKFLETGESASYGAAPGGRVQTSRSGGDANADLDEMPTIEGMSGGGEVGNSSTIVNYGLYNGGGMIHNAGSPFNNFNTLDSKDSFNPVFGFTGGGITLPNVTIPNMKTNISLMSGGGVAGNILNVNDIRFSGGGDVTNNTGVDITGAGPDTQLTALQPGEIVMSKSAVNYWGANTLLGMNKAGGGTNVPKMANNIQMAAGGGMVGSTLDPTKTAASMPHVFEAAQAARAQARAEGLSPSEVEKRVVQASEQAKAAGPVTAPPKRSNAFGSLMSMDGPPSPGNPAYGFSSNSMGGGSMLSVPSRTFRVNAPIFADTGLTSSSFSTGSRLNLGMSSSSMMQTGNITYPPASSLSPKATTTYPPASSLSPKGTTTSGSMPSSSFFPKGTTTYPPASSLSPKATTTSGSMSSSSFFPKATTTSGSMPSMPFKSERLNDALTGIKPGAWKNKKITLELKAETSSSMSPVATPRGGNKPNIVELPPTTTTVGVPKQADAPTPEVPKFSPIKNTSKRGAALSALGIADLIGAQ